MRSRVRSLLLSAFILVAVTGCDPSRLFSSNPRVTGDIFAAKIRWAAHGYSRYEFILTVGGCECSIVSPVRVTVTNGVIDGVYTVDSSSPVQRGDWPDYRSIEGLLAAAADAIDRNAWAVRGDYDAAQGYPRDLYIDWKELIVDDEMHYTVSALRAR